MITADVPLWVALGVIFSVLNLVNRDEASPRSPLFFLEAPLFLLMIAGIWADQRLCSNASLQADNSRRGE